MRKERGSLLIEALLMMGLFLWFIVMANQTMSRYWLLVNEAQVSGGERVRKINQFEGSCQFHEKECD